MTRGELLRKLFQSYKRRDDQAFEYAARLLVEEERQKHHNLLAADLEHLLDGTQKRLGRAVPTDAIRRFDELPRDRERNGLLLEVRTPRRSLEEMILDEENRSVIDEILREFRRSDLLQTHSLQPRHRLLFCGPPGCGKSLCAEVIAAELDLPLLYTRFDAVISSYLGETAANLRSVFDYAARGSWVLFFDEVDVIAKSRDDAAEHGELKRVVSSFLQILDAFRSNSIVIAATNHEGLLDAAIWRRFDEILHFAPPTDEQVIPLLHLKLGAIRHRDVNLARFVPKLSGLSHSDIERICHDAMRASLTAGERSLHEDVFARAVQRHRRRLAITVSSRQGVVKQGPEETDD